MPKEKESLRKKYMRFCKEFGSDIFTCDNIEGNQALMCQPCNTAVNPSQRCQMEQHINTSKHKANLKRWTGHKQLTLSEMTKPKDGFNKEMLKWMVENDIAIDKLNKKSFTDFLSKHIKREMPSHMTIRRQLDGCYDETIDNIGNKIGSNNIWVSVDETVDAIGRCVGNVIIGSLKSGECGQSFLVNSKDLDGKVNNTTIATLVDDTIKMLWPEGFDRNRFLLLVTDGAHYMKVAGENLKAFYPKLIHITCMAHLINRIVDCIRCNHKLTDKFIAEVKKIFTKSRSRNELFKSIAPDLPLPPKPVITRWSTWLNASFYYAKNFDVIKLVLEKLNPEDAICIANAQKLLSKNDLKTELSYLLTNFQFIPEMITSIQAKDVMLSYSVQIIENLDIKLSAIDGSFGDIIRAKFDFLINKNKSFEIVKKISSIIKGEESDTIEDLSPEQISCFKFAPITSCDVERSFSKYKLMLNQRKHGMLFENFTKSLIINCNSEI
jgi:hypothetical protein